MGRWGIIPLSVFIDTGLKVDAKRSAGEGSAVVELILAIIHLQAR